MVLRRKVPSKADLYARIDNDRGRLTTFLQHFVQAPSANPPGETVAAAKVLGDYLHDHGVEPEVITVKKDNLNLVHSFSSSARDATGLDANQPTLVMNGHIDVFPVSAEELPNWKHDPWSGDVEDGRLYGRGTVDMKAGTAALIAAYAYLFSVRQALSGTLVLTVVSDEETGGKYGSKYLVHDDPRKELWRGSVVLNTEPSSLQSIRFAEKGTLRISFSVKTKAAHGAYLHLSEGAIRIAARLINRLITLEDFVDFDLDPSLRKYLESKAVRDTIDEIMGPGAANNIIRPTVNIGTIKGGSKINMIPGECDFEADIRLPIGLTAEKVLAKINDILQDFPEASYKIQEAASNPPNSCWPSHPLVDALAENAESVLGRRPVAIPSMGATDCKHWRILGIPAYTYGVSPKGMAGVDENVKVEDYINLVKVLVGSAWDFLNGSG